MEPVNGLSIKWAPCIFCGLLTSASQAFHNVGTILTGPGIWLAEPFSSSNWHIFLPIRFPGIWIHANASKGGSERSNKAAIESEALNDRSSLQACKIVYALCAEL